ncbi:hypothetical protein RFI_06028 [Reticulomyxa filosa]|uniref:Uncharacterized protein n=1 Tax=Reticulomyxa filosa TaxID=46433 RepID=X6NYY1_RETFI|nr:hypothetical protein RFI_06028 [Reticulomyxa filosa]|eukprot:ETO31093.1 hypothetical protein RFI_06028 [Reticulomyxa filosa]
MSNEFQEFLGLLGRLIKFIIVWTINLVCGAVLLCACCAVWRIYGIIQFVFKSNSQSKFFLLYELFKKKKLSFEKKKYREKFWANSMKQLGLSLFDIITLFVGLMSLCIPTRTYHFFKGYYKAFTGSKEEDPELFYIFELRFCMWQNLSRGLLDLITLPWGLLSLIFPTRTLAFFKNLKNKKIKKEFVQKIRKTMPMTITRSCVNFG